MSEIFFNTAGMRTIGNEISELSTLLTGLHEELTQIRNRLGIELYQSLFNEFIELDESFSDIASRLAACIRYLPGAEEAYRNAESAVKSELERIYSEYYYYHTKLDYIAGVFNFTKYSDGNFENYLANQTGLALAPTKLPSEHMETLYIPITSPRRGLSSEFADAVFSVLIPGELFEHIKEIGINISEKTEYLEYIPNAYMLPGALTLTLAAGGTGVSKEFANVVTEDGVYEEINAARSGDFEHAAQTLQSNGGLAPDKAKSTPFRRVRRFTPSVAEQQMILKQEKRSFKKVTLSTGLRNFAFKPFSDASFRSVRGLRLTRSVSEIPDGFSERFSAGLGTREQSGKYTAGVFNDSEFLNFNTANLNANNTVEAPGVPATAGRINFVGLDNYFVNAETPAVEARETEDYLTADSSGIRPRFTQGISEIPDGFSERYSAGFGTREQNSKYTPGVFNDSEFRNFNTANLNAYNTVEAPGVPASTGRVDFDGLGDYFVNAETPAIEAREIIEYLTPDAFVFIEDTRERLTRTGLVEAKEYADFIPTKLLPEFNNSYVFENIEWLRFIEDAAERVIPAVAVTGFLADIDGFRFVEDGVGRDIHTAGISVYYDYDELSEIENNSDVETDTEVDSIGEYTYFENNALPQNKFKSASYIENQKSAFEKALKKTIPARNIKAMLPFITETYFIGDNDLYIQIERELAEFQYLSELIFGDSAQVRLPKVNVSVYYDYLLNDEFIRQQKSIPPVFSERFEELRFERILHGHGDTGQTEAVLEDSEGFMLFSTELSAVDEETQVADASDGIEDFTNIGYTSSGDNQIDDICEKIISGEVFAYSFAGGLGSSNHLNKISSVIKENYTDYDMKKKAATAIMGATVAYISNELVSRLLSNAIIEAEKDEKSINSTAPQFDLEYREIEDSYTGNGHIQEKKIVGNINGSTKEEIYKKMSSDVSTSVLDAIEHKEHELTEPKKIKLYLQNLYEKSFLGEAAAGSDGTQEIVIPASKGNNGSLVELEYTEKHNFFGINFDEETADKLAGVIAVSTAAQILEATGKRTVLKFKKTGKNRRKVRKAVEDGVKRFESTINTVSEFIEDVLDIGKK